MTILTEPVYSLNQSDALFPHRVNVPAGFGLHLRRFGTDCPPDYAELRVLEHVRVVDGETSLTLSVQIASTPTDSDLAEDTNTIIASVDVLDWETKGGWLHKFWVAERYRRAYVGRVLLGRLLTIAREQGKSGLSLGVRPTNPAYWLYHSLGFQTVGKLAEGSRMMAITFPEAYPERRDA